MKVTPIKDYREPRYPTIAEIDSVDLSRVPTRWQNLKAVAASLGAAAMTLKAISIEAAETTSLATTVERGISAVHLHFVDQPRKGHGCLSFATGEDRGRGTRSVRLRGD